MIDCHVIWVGVMVSILLPQATNSATLQDYNLQKVVPYNHKTQLKPPCFSNALHLLPPDERQLAPLSSAASPALLCAVRPQAPDLAFTKLTGTTGDAAPTPSGAVEKKMKTFSGTKIYRAWKKGHKRWRTNKIHRNQE